MEYYETQGSAKYKIYKNRMQQFLSKHCIESLLEGKKATFIARKEIIERNKNHAIYSTKDEVQKIIDKSQQKA